MIHYFQGAQTIMRRERIANTEFLFKQLSWDEVVNDAARLRFQVYCVERGFISESAYPDGKELDEYDEDSVHFGIYIDASLAGYARLVLNKGHGLPIFKYAPFVKDKVKKFPPDSIGEISRLVISKTFRRRQNDGAYYDPLPYLDKARAPFRRIRPMVFGIYRDIYTYCKRNNINRWLVLMEPSLWRLLSMTNINFERIGGEVECMGIVNPYMLNLSDAEKEMALYHPHYYDYFTKDLDDNLKMKF